MLTQSLLNVAQSPDGSPLQKRRFDQLFRETDKYSICKNRRFSPDIAEEAMNLTRMAICGCDRANSINANLIRRLCNSAKNSHNLNQLYFSTFKVIFRNKAVDIIRQNPSNVLSIDVQINSESPETFADFMADWRLSGWDLLLRDEFTDNVINFIDYIINDGAELKQCHVRNKPHINAQFLIIEHLLNHETWQNIATKLNASIGTITGRFFYHKTIPLLQEIAQRFDVI